jgi:STE24 endopeptidase
VTLERTDLRTRPRERWAPWVTIAILLALGGALASLWRPLAPVPVAYPTDLDGFDTAVLTAVQSYRGPKLVVANLATALGVLVPVWIVLSHRGRNLVTRLAGPRSHSPASAALVGFTISFLVSLTIFPLAAWSRVVHDGSWGFRTQPPIGWFRDWLLVSGGTALGVAVLSAILVVGMARWPRTWPYRLTVLGTGLATLLVLVHPVLLQPVLLPTAPFPDGPHRQAIAPVLAAAGDPDLPLVVGEASRRSTRVNALVTGIGPTARVVVYDNLLELPPDQVASVVAHELAHHEHRDVPRGIALTATALLPALLLVQRVVGSSGVQRRLRVRGPADPRLVAVVLATAAVLELAGQPVANLVSRRLEAAADVRAMELTGDPETLIRTTRVFTIRDLSPPDPPPWVTVMYRTHPSVAERIRRAVQAAEEAGIELPAREDVARDEAAQRHPDIRDDAT